MPPVLRYAWLLRTKYDALREATIFNGFVGSRVSGLKQILLLLIVGANPYRRNWNGGIKQRRSPKPPEEICSSFTTEGEPSNCHPNCTLTK